MQLTAHYINSNTLSQSRVIVQHGSIFRVISFQTARQQNLVHSNILRNLFVEDNSLQGATMLPSGVSLSMVLHALASNKHVGALH